MKILSFGVNNFCGISGGIEKNTINFKNSNTIFIFGQNNVGKSTFLKAYDFFYNNTKFEDLHLNNKEISNVIEFELTLELDDFDFAKIDKNAPGKLFSLKSNYLSQYNILRIKREITPVKKKGKIEFEKAKNYTFNFNEDKWDEKNYGGIGLDNVFQSLLPKPIFIHAMPTEEQVEKIINDILSAQAEKRLSEQDFNELENAKDTIKKLNDKLYNPVIIAKYKEEANLHFQKLFPNNRIEFEDLDKMSWTEKQIGKKFKIHFPKIDEKGDNIVGVPTNYQNIGHGAIRSAIFSLLLMRDIAEEFERVDNRKDYIVLFEEPELFLHPKIMKDLRELIYKVSEDDMPYQVICASHSPQMIDITKDKTSLVRMTKNGEGFTNFYQINEDFLIANIQSDKDKLKQELYEILRFNPYICESFYADEVILVEGPTEEIILRGYLNEAIVNKDIFVANCGTINNMPFYQKVFSEFNIKYSVIFDVDGVGYSSQGDGTFLFDSGIQKSISNRFIEDKNIGIGKCVFIHDSTFEPAHASLDVPEFLRFNEKDYNKSDGKPYNANLYWRNILSKNLEHPEIKKVPIINAITTILSSN